MKAKKCQALLALYDHLLDNGKVVKKDFVSTYEVSDISFKRYMSELRSYFTNFAPYYDVRYNRKEDVYYFFKNK